MSIAGIWEKLKGYAARIPDGMVTIAIVVLAATGSFGLGYLSGTENGEGEIQIEQRPTKEVLPAAAAAAGTHGISSSDTDSAPPPIAAGGQYVASKKGSKYHFPWCPGAKAMSEENKIYFANKEEAEAAGYTPASNCKGI